MTRRHLQRTRDHGERTTRRRRGLTGALAVVLVGTGLVLAGPARAGHGGSGARGVDVACPPGEVDSAGFTDIGDQGEGQQAAIDCIAAHDVTKGVSATIYDPSGTVTRGQMASFVMRTLDRVLGYERPADAPDAFGDDDGSTHEVNIDDAAAEGIVLGRADGTYGAGARVTRAQMASFVARTLEVAGVDVPTDAPDAFGDDDGRTHEAYIDALAHLHIVEGTGAGNYSPAAPVTRAQMALFLGRTLDLLVDDGLAEQAAGRDVPSNVVATATGASTVNVRWSEPAAGPPGFYQVHRRTVAGPDTACPLSGYEKVAEVASPTRLLDDTGLIVDTTYCYRVAARTGTTVSALSNPARATTSDAPRMESGLADTGAETVTVTYDQPVTCVTGSASQFAYGGSTSAKPTGAACTSGAGTNTLVLTFADVTGGGDLTYTQSTDPALRVKKQGGKDAVTPQTIAVVDPPPKIELAEANTSADEVVVTYSEAVSCETSSFSQFSYKIGTAPAVKPTVIDGCKTSRSANVVLTFASDAITGPGTLTYTESTDPLVRITDAGGNHAISPESVADTPPKMVSAAATPEPSDTDPTAGDTTVVVTYDQAIACTTSIASSASQFALAGMTDPPTAACASSAPKVVTLTFSATADTGSLTYTADAADPGKRIKDAASREAVTPQTIAVDYSPFMRISALDAKKLTVTYTEPVTCATGAAERFTLKPPSSGVKPVAAACNGSSVVLTFGIDIASAATLQYATTTVAGAGVRDTTGNQAVGQTLDVKRPTIVSATADTAGDKVAVTYSEVVSCTAGSFSQFSYKIGSATAVKPTEISGCDTGADIVTLSFAPGAVTGAGDLTYTQAAATADRVKDPTGNDATSPQTILVDDPSPEMESASSSGNTITVTWSEPVTCNGSQAAAEQFTYDLANPPNAKATGIECDETGTETVVLTFDQILAGAGVGTLKYAGTDGNEIKDEGGNRAVNGDHTVT